MKKLFIFGIALFIGASMVTGVISGTKSQSQLMNLALLEIESLANSEGTEGSEWKTATPHDCNYTKNVIIEGSNQVISITVPGKKGICDGYYGSCNSWPCTQILQ